METNIYENLNALYLEFMEQLSIDNTTGILGKISNKRYSGQKLRFSGMPYVGRKYSESNLKILFVGLDTGIDELREDDSFHNFDSRRKRIAGSVEGCTTLGYNNHISGMYGMALYILKDYFSWINEWNLFSKDKNAIFFSAINSLSTSLPIEVLDYVAFTNIHKFVTVCRGCDFSKKKPNCWTESCSNNNFTRSGSYNRKWYNEKEEKQFLFDEIDVFNPDIIYFQGSHRPILNLIKSLNLKYEIWIADHPSAWSVGANKINYVDSKRLTKNPICTM
jgi:hypothetical protein